MAGLGPAIHAFEGPNQDVDARTKPAQDELGAVGMLAFSAGRASLALSSIVVGAFVPGVVPLALGRVHELDPDDNAEVQRRAWVRCTIAFALGQAVTAYGFSALFAHTAGFYPLLFALGATALLLALVIDLSAATTRRRATHE